MGALSERLTRFRPSRFKCAICLGKGALNHQFPSTLVRLRSAIKEDAKFPRCVSNFPCSRKSGDLHLFLPRKAHRDLRLNAVGKKGVSYLELEMQIFRFMETSSNPDAFPTRKELIDAGRWDLVNAIQLEGGWLAVGWEDEIEEETFRMSSGFESLNSSKSWQNSIDNIKSKPSSLFAEGRDLNVDTGVVELRGHNNKASGVKGVGLSSRSDSSFMSRLDALTNEHIANLGLGFDNWGSEAFRARQKNRSSVEKKIEELENLEGQNGAAGKGILDGDTWQHLNGAPSPAGEADISAEVVVQLEDAKESAEEKKFHEISIPEIAVQDILQEFKILETAEEEELQDSSNDAESTGADQTDSFEEGTLVGSSSETEFQNIANGLVLEGPLRVEGAEEVAAEVLESPFDEQEMEVFEKALQETRTEEFEKALQGEIPTQELGAGEMSSELPPKGKLPNYWRDEENLWNEMRAAQKSLGLPDDAVPSKRQLISIKRWDILRAVKKSGGMQQVVAGQQETEKISKPKPPQLEPPAPEAEPELSPLDRLLNLVGLGPKIKVKGPKASVSSPPKEVDEKTKAEDEQQVAQQLRDSLMPQFFRKKKGKRRDETEIELADEREKKIDVVKEESTEAETRTEIADVLKEESNEPENQTTIPDIFKEEINEPETRTEIADVVEDREEEEAEVSNKRENEINLRAEPEMSTSKTEPAVQTSSLLQRIRALEQSLAATKDSLQNGREYLSENREFLRGLRLNTLRELSEVSDALEFREDEMQRTAQALRRTQAEMRVFEGSIASKSLGDPDLEHILADPKNPEEVLTVVELRTVRVVWPHEGHVVELTGSFNSWQERIKMKKSNAGVFIATLSLPPGRYELKFIVDGVWRVDAQRLITYADGNENNVLNVF